MTTNARRLASPLALLAAAVAAWTLARPSAATQPSAPPSPGPPASPAASPAVAASTPSGATPDTGDQERLINAMAAMTSDERLYHEHNVTLSNAWFEGRAPGTRGNELVREYVEWHFRKYGLKPVFPSVGKDSEGNETKTPFSSYRQSFTIRGARETVAKKQSLSFAGPDGVDVLVAGADFNARGISGNGSVTDAPVVFVGYGIQEGRDGYSTFAPPAKDADGKDVYPDDLTGKVAILLRLEPLKEDGESRWAAEGQTSAFVDLDTKIRNVSARNPAAILVCFPPGANDPRAGALEFTRQSARGVGRKFPVFTVTTRAVDALCHAAGTTLMTLRRQADERGGVTLLANVTVSGEVELSREAVSSENVGGLLRGRGPLKDEYIVIGAHIDHVGYGFFGSRDGADAAGRLHPGADDNASGTAGLLVAAKNLAAHYASLPDDANVRSIIFAGFNAEEGGLIGSRAMVRNMPVDLKKVYAMLNMDMIGRLRENKLEICGTKTAENFEEWLEPYVASSGLTIRKVGGGSGPSDHASFFTAGVPVLAFFTDLHEQYHRPSDTFEHINSVGAVRVVKLCSDIALGLATRPEPLLFVRTRAPSIGFMSGEGEETTTLPGVQPAAPDGAAPGAAAPAEETPAMRSPGRIRFGISPGNYGEEGAGVEVGDVFPGTPAADAGLKKGDVMTHWNGEKVGSVEEWMPMFRKAKAGDEVTVTIKRGSETLQLKALLKPRETTPERKD